MFGGRECVCGGFTHRLTSGNCSLVLVSVFGFSMNMLINSHLYFAHIMQVAGDAVQGCWYFVERMRQKIKRDILGQFKRIWPKEKKKFLSSIKPLFSGQDC